MEDTELCCGGFLLATSRIVKESIAFASESVKAPKADTLFLDVNLDIPEISYSNILKVKIARKVGLVIYKVTTVTSIMAKDTFIPILEIKASTTSLKITNLFNNHTLEKTFLNSDVDTTGIRERNRLIFDLAYHLTKECI